MIRYHVVCKKEINENRNAAEKHEFFDAWSLCWHKSKKAADACVGKLYSDKKIWPDCHKQHVVMKEVRKAKT